MGRRRIYADTMKHKVMVRLPDDSIEILTQVAAREEMELGALIRKLLHRWMEAEGLRPVQQISPKLPKKATRAA